MMVYTSLFVWTALQAVSYSYALMNLELTTSTKESPPNFHHKKETLQRLVVNENERHLASSLLINQEPFVFSHNAATGYLVVPDGVTGPFVYGYVKNQRESFTEQFNCGARALDLEFRKNAAGEIVFAHGEQEIPEVTLQDGFEEIKAWAEEHQEDLVLLSIDTLIGCDDCLQEISSILGPVGINPIVTDCSIFETLTIQDALDQFGNVLAASKSCFVQNYDQSLSCHGFMDTKDPNNVQAVRDCAPAGLATDASINSFTQVLDCLDDALTTDKVDVYDCWADSDTTEVPFARLESFLDNVARNEGPPQSGFPWQLQGLWQGNPDGILLGLFRPLPLPNTVFGLEPSSILMDVEQSLINQRFLKLVFQLVQDNVTLNLVEVDDVCDEYGSQLLGVLRGETPATFEPQTPNATTRTREPFEKVTYDEVGATRSFRAIPRFGHTDQFSEAFGSQDERNDYIQGLLFVGTFVLAIFLVWLILFPIFMLLGQRRVGFLSGRALQASRESKKPRIIRIIFITAAVIVIIFSVLLVTEGITKLENSIDTVYEGTVEVNTLLTDTKASVDTLNITGKSAISLRDEVVVALEGDFCPDGDLESETNTDFDAISQQVITFLNDLGNFTEEDVDDLGESLRKSVSSANDVVSTTEDVKVKDWQSLIFIIPLPIFCVALTLATVLAWFDYSNKWIGRFVSWVILPLFVLWVVLCCVLAGISAISASANADFCSGGDDKMPESSVQDIMKINDVDETELLYRTVQYYINQCEGSEDPLQFLYEYEDDLEKAHSKVTILDKAITDTTVEEIIRICGDQKYLDIAELVSKMEDQANTLMTVANETEDLLACETYAPIYTKTVYDGTCTLSVQGFTWMFSSFLVIGFMGFLMITFRSAVHPTKYLTEELKENAPMKSYAQEQAVPREAEEEFETADGAMGNVASGMEENYEGEKEVEASGAAIGPVASGMDENYEEEKEVESSGAAMGPVASGMEENYNEGEEEGEAAGVASGTEENWVGEWEGEEPGVVGGTEENYQKGEEEGEAAGYIAKATEEFYEEVEL